MNLKAELDVVEQRIADEKQKGAEADKGLVSKLEEQQAAILAQMDVEKANQSHTQRVQEANTEIAYILDTLTVDGLTMRDMCVGENEYQLLRISVQQSTTERIDQISKQLQGAEERELQMRRQNDDLQDKLEAMEAALRQKDQLIQEANARAFASDNRANQLEFERDEALKRVDNAATIIDEGRAEIDRLNSQVDDLRKEISVGARNAFKIVDTEAQIAELTKKIRESRIKVINMRPDPSDFKRATWLAEDAATGQMYSFNHLEKGKYLEVTPEEGLQFRNEWLQQQAEQALPDLTLAVETPAVESITEPQFPETDTPEGGLGLVGEAQGEGSVAGTEVTRAEFDKLREEVMGRLFDLEAQVFGVDRVVA